MSGGQKQRVAIARQCDRIFKISDDIPMFLISDESYAVGNAVNELKDIATMVIGSNDAVLPAEKKRKEVRVQ